MFIFRKLLDRAVVDHKDWHRELIAQRRQTHAARGGFLSNADEALIGGLQIGRKKIAAIVQQHVRFLRQDLLQGLRVDTAVLGSFGMHIDAVASQVVDGGGLCAAKVTCGHHPSTASL